MGDLGHIFYSDYYVLRIITYYYEKLRLLTLCFMSGLQTVGCRHQLSLSCLQQITVLNQFLQTLFLNLSGWGYKGLYENTKCYQNCPLKGDVHFSFHQSLVSSYLGISFLLCYVCPACAENRKSAVFLCPQKRSPLLLQKRKKFCIISLQLSLITKLAK